MLVSVTLELVDCPVQVIVVPVGVATAVAVATLLGAISIVTVPLMLEGVFGPTPLAVLDEFPETATTASVPGGLLVGFGVQKLAAAATVYVHEALMLIRSPT